MTTVYSCNKLTGQACVVVDTTVQEKAVAHPTDSRQLEVAREKIARRATRAGSALMHRHQHEGEQLSRRGFTLLELLVVVAIIALLAAYVGPKFFAQVGKSEATVAKAQIEAFSRALDAYRLNTGRYPTTEEGLAALVTAPPNVDRWSGPYLQKAAPADPWNRAYIYRSPGAKAEFEIVSLGRDGQVGGVGDAADITYP